jgi:hypothetical protein
LARRGVPVAGVYMDRRVGEEVRGYGIAMPMVHLGSHVRLRDAATAAGHATTLRRELVRWAGSAPGSPAERLAASFAVGRLHRGYLAQTSIDLRAVERLLDARRPTAVVVASDAHRYARLLVLAARDRKIPTVVLQHGALAFQDFYVPVVADRMLAWGPWCRDWFVARGAPAPAVHDVGFVRSPARRPLRSPADPAALRAMFPTQPVADHVTVAMLDTLREVLAADASLRLVVRPHPGEGRRALLAARLAGWPAPLRERTDVSPPGRALADDLAASDVVLTSQSTVGIDALAAGVPVVLIDHPDVAEPIPFRAFGCVVGAETAGDVAAGLAALRDDAFVARLARAVDAFLEAYVGRADAAALAAAADAVEALATDRPVGGAA